MAHLNSVITGIGSYIPEVIKTNDEFLTNTFLNEDGTPFEQENEVIIQKFKEITGIEERRYAKDDENSSDLGFNAAKSAIEDAGIDQETLDHIIVAHNFGDVASGSIQPDVLPSLSSRIKHRLGIKNPNCIAYDILFGCPGWVQGVIQAHAYIKAGIAKKILVVGTEALSRVVDEHDRDTMIFSDGAGACIIEAKEETEKRGILSFSYRTDTLNESHYLRYGKAYGSNTDSKDLYVKMQGRKIYEYALSLVPSAMKKALDEAEIPINDLEKIFIHQANEKMDEAIIKRFFRLYKMKTPQHIMPMSIRLLGNSSVATVPTLFDMVLKGKISGHSVSKGNIVMFASVGSGMNINAVVYKM
ncbi:MAG: 3-oxoacyl-ACP synthase [Flavobacteriia bacterium]|nr:MAG: 3-oxoacyl-ACP synthase [Flavobacteriia bacterium]